MKGEMNMTIQIILNGKSFSGSDFIEETMIDQKNKIERKKISFTFPVTSEEYHDVTTLLYENDFNVTVPDKNLQFEATIYRYATPLTNLYEDNQVSEYELELIEKLS